MTAHTPPQPRRESAVPPRMSGTMKAIVQTGYGSPDVLELRDIEKPALEPDRVLVRVRASSVNAGDWHLLRGRPAAARPMMGGFRRPNRNPGTDVAGIVEAVGEAVTDLGVGDEVYGLRSGAFAEYVAALTVVPKPTNLTFEEAAAVPVAGCTALEAVRDRGAVQPGQRVLVNGAGGGVGTFVVQIARAFGADVTAVTRTDSVELVESLGAHRVIDRTREDFTRRTERYDVVIDVGGTPSLAACRRVLTTDGTLVLVGAGRGGAGPLGRLAASVVRARVLRQRVIFFIASAPKEDLLRLKQLIESGKVRPVIDSVYPLHEAAAAIRHVGSGRARGKVVITIPERDYRLRKPIATGCCHESPVICGHGNDEVQRGSSGLLR